VFDTYRGGRPGAGPSDLLCALETDRMFRIPGIRLAEAQVANGARTFAYLFSWESAAFDGRIKAAHAVDLAFVWDNLADRMATKLVGENAPQALADDMHGAWIRFVNDGDPGWPAYDIRTRTTREFGGSNGLIGDPCGAERAVWERIL
jgi:para-nitrobenzyl esterase